MKFFLIVGILVFIEMKQCYQLGELEEGYVLNGVSLSSIKSNVKVV